MQEFGYAEQKLQSAGREFLHPFCGNSRTLYKISRSMLSLGKGTYLANTDKSLFDEDILVNLTSYPNIKLYDTMHCHENSHISFVLSGGNLEKRRNTEVERTSGKITFYHSGEYHQSTCLKNYSRHINLELQPQFLNENGINESLLNLAVANSPDAKFLLLKTYKELNSDDKWSSVSIKLILFELINHYSYLQYNRRNHFWIDKVDEILHDNIHEQLSLNYLSNILDMHPVTISKQFHKYFSCTLGEYVRKLRIEKALNLIKTSQYTLTEIAYECGFSDQSHFTRTFKALTGLLPTQFEKL